MPFSILLEGHLVNPPLFSRKASQKNSQKQKKMFNCVGLRVQTREKY